MTKIIWKPGKEHFRNIVNVQVEKSPILAPVWKEKHTVDLN